LEARLVFDGALGFCGDSGHFKRVAKAALFVGDTESEAVTTSTLLARHAGLSPYGAALCDFGQDTTGDSG
jgi:hypothetical protein